VSGLIFLIPASPALAQQAPARLEVTWDANFTDFTRFPPYELGVVPVSPPPGLNEVWQYLPSYAASTVCNSDNSICATRPAGSYTPPLVFTFDGSARGQVYDFQGIESSLLWSPPVLHATLYDGPVVKHFDWAVPPNTGIGPMITSIGQFSIAGRYNLWGEILDGSAWEQTPISGGDPLTAQAPLGLELQLILKDGTAPIKAKWELEPVTPAGLSQPALYPNSVMLEYNASAHEATKTFRAVHLGEQILTITPDDTNIPTFKVKLGAFDPGLLGNDNKYDSVIVDWGNRRGMPPHLLKAQMLKESGDSGGLDAEAYRYEPLNTTGEGEQEVQAHITDTPFRDYRLSTASGLSKGSLLLDPSFPAWTYAALDDVSARQKFTIRRGTIPAGATEPPAIKIRPVDECPDAAGLGAGCVSVKEIVANNDAQNGHYSWTKYAPAYRPLTQAKLNALSFTAQPQLAASYGWMQAMYTNVKQFKWHAPNGSQNPSLLYDTPANLAAGAGSMSYGTLEFYWWYDAIRDGDWIFQPNFHDALEFESLYLDALNAYNHGYSDQNITYASDIWQYSLQFSPAHPFSKIFPVAVKK
jgi:hypothetical protein